MKVLTDYLQELSDYENIKRGLAKKETVAINGLVDSQKLHMMYGLSEEYPVRVILTYSDLRAKEIWEEYRFYDKETVYFPGKDFIFFQADIHGNKLTRERICAYRKILEGKPITVVTTFDSIMSPCIPIKVLEQNRIFLDDTINVEEGALARQLVKMGYEKCHQVESPGQFSIRGGIVDVYDFTEENPYRIELWGDEIESIRSFDVLSQRSIENLERIVIYPATEFILSEDEKKQGLDLVLKEAKKTCEILRKQFKTEEAARVISVAEGLKEQISEFGSMANLESFIRYFYKEVVSFLDFFAGRKTVLFLDEPTRIREHGEAVELEFRESMMHRIEKGYALSGQGNILFSQGEIAGMMGKFPVAAFALLESKKGIVPIDNSYHMLGKSINSFGNSFEALVKELEGFKKKGYRVLLASASRTRAKRLAEDLFEHGLSAFYSEDMNKHLEAGQIMVFYGNLKRGFEYPLIQFAILSESDIFGEKKKKKKKKKRYEGEKINDFTELKVGDYVVHENHGLGIYKGIEKVQVEKVVKDYMKIEYRDGGNLYVLATAFDVIQKYASADAKKPKLNKLGTKEWDKTKTKVKTATMEVAKELVQLYAIRQEREGYVFGKDTVWQKEFEELFPYEETEDQLVAIEETKKDMESTKIMDRLVCGDVGYGKTEVAIRAAFKAVQEGKQVVYLVPTTILAQQHYDTFVQRMKNYPINIELLSRFRTSAQQKKAIEGLKKGIVDIVIGTHRLLSKDVAFKDLGLLIIDEEQRFGVTHKEKIKQLKENIDVLTLTATPIPRTLHMSLIGIRDMSVLEEPPNERMPIQTYVMEYNEEMVREAIVRELTRQGQVYYVYNRVNQIDEIAMNLQNLVPEANVAFAHGQMKERELEEIMYDFINGEIDVLVCTTIIETGLDIANANTMIIHDSDNLGLSQLYQLRGRVGRSNRNAYAFLMYKRDKMLKEVAEKRLQAIKEFTDLGSGFKIAMKDLEIRGAGNLLGAKQHGHMEAVGYDLYCKMLNDAVKSLKGYSQVVDFNTTVDMDVDAYIPPEYIVNEFQKLDIYKRIAAIENQEEYDEMKEELLDRFGAVPDSVENLLRIALIRVRAHKVYGTELKGKKDRLILTVHEKAPLIVENIPKILKKYEGKLLFSPKGVPVFTYKLYPTGFLKKDEEALLQAAEDLLEDMEKELV